LLKKKGKQQHEGRGGQDNQDIQELGEEGGGRMKKLSQKTTKEKRVE